MYITEVGEIDGIGLPVQEIARVDNITDYRSV